MPNYIADDYWTTGYTKSLADESSGRSPGNELELAALSRLVGQFDNSSKLRNLISAITSPLDIALFDISNIENNRWIDTAEGTQLDGCGYIVGESRLGRSDEDYRTAIKFRIFVNVSKGTPQDLISGLKFLTNPTDSQYIEQYPATAILFTNGFDVPQNISTQIQDITPAGVSNVSVCVSFASNPLRFGKEPPPGELFVNNESSYLTANESDVQVSTGAVPAGASVFGGCIASDLGIGIIEKHLELSDGSILAVYNPNTTKTIGHDYLTGVYQ